jgi:antitoxin component YwqK of YwqJK toxin-antitoxin module
VFQLNNEPIAMFLKIIRQTRIAIAPFLFVLIMLIPDTGISQELQNSSVNQVDDKGRKQGKWKAFDVNGNLKFEGQFIDNIPVGTFVFYYPDEQIKARSEMYDHGRRSRTKTFHPNGRLMAEGNYLDKQKDSTWNYYSDFDGVLISTENYKDGQLDGMVYNFYPAGGIAEEIPYVNGVKDGVWKRFFTDGKLKLKATYVNGMLEGLMLVYFQNGVPEISGMYEHNLKNGLWLYFNDRGQTLKKETYKQGNLKKTEDFDIK